MHKALITIHNPTAREPITEFIYWSNMDGYLSEITRLIKAKGGYCSTYEISYQGKV